MPPSPLAEPVDVSDAILRSLPVPRHDEGDDKEDRGRVLVVGGSRRTPGAVILAGIAALRVGAGKLQIATATSVATAVGVAVPEALVEGLPEDDAGDVAGAKAVAALLELADGARAVVIGPGLLGPDAVDELVGGLVGDLPPEVALVLDAAALTTVAEHADALRRRAGPVVVTPNLAELATMAGCDPDELTAERLRAVVPEMAESLQATVACEAWIAAPGSPLYRHDIGDVGLATSGSGDVLAGAVGGLCAQGADGVTSALLGVHLHSAAGARLSARIGRVGYLARELLDELPVALAEVTRL
jgi:hydroxyethylthiazole kinase-like uncharacterized protein yjeF